MLIEPDMEVEISAVKHLGGSDGGCVFDYLFIQLHWVIYYIGTFDHGHTYGATQQYWTSSSC